LTKENVKGDCPGVVAIMGMPLMLVSYDRGRLARDQTPHSFMKKNIFITFLFFLNFLNKYLNCLFPRKPLSWFGSQMMIIPLTRL